MIACSSSCLPRLHTIMYAFWLSTLLVLLSAPFQTQHLFAFSCHGCGCAYPSLLFAKLATEGMILHAPQGANQIGSCLWSCVFSCMPTTLWALLLLLCSSIIIVWKSGWYSISHEIWSVSIPSYSIQSAVPSSAQYSSMPCPILFRLLHFREKSKLLSLLDIICLFPRFSQSFCFYPYQLSLGCNMLSRKEELAWP